MNTSFFPFRRQVRCEIRPAEAGRSLLRFLSDRFDYRDTGQWAELIAQRRLLINDRPGASDSLLAAGDRVEFLISAGDEPPVDSAYAVLYEDDALLAVDKPGNLPIHPAGVFFKNTLWGLLKVDRPELEAHFVNRLDRETSGIVLIAKTSEMCARCATSLAADDAEKVYWALVEGNFPEAVDSHGSIHRHPTSAIRKKFIFRPWVDFSTCGSCYSEAGPRMVSTRFRKLCSGASLSLLDVRLQSGRTHQIRATLEGLGYPLVGDKLYGVDETIFLRFIGGRISECDWRRLRLRRQALHAGRLVFRHPCTGVPLSLFAPLPEEMASVRL